MVDELADSAIQQVPWRAAEAHAAELELERSRWTAVTAFVELLTRDERLVPGYYKNPDWSVKDLIAHFGRWMLEAREQLLNIAARSYLPHEVDVGALNAATLAESRAESWDSVWARTIAARAWMLEAWFGMRGPDEAANQWIRKAGAEHYGEHLARLRDWVAELVYLRTHQPKEEWDT